MSACQYWKCQPFCYSSFTIFSLKDKKAQLVFFPSCLTALQRKLFRWSWKTTTSTSDINSAGQSITKHPTVKPRVVLKCRCPLISLSSFSLLWLRPISAQEEEGLKIWCSKHNELRSGQFPTLSTIHQTFTWDMTESYYKNPLYFLVCFGMSSCFIDHDSMCSQWKKCRSFSQDDIKLLWLLPADCN